MFGPWFLCAHFSMDLTSKIIYPLLVGGGVVLIYMFHIMKILLSMIYVTLETEPMQQAILFCGTYVTGCIAKW